MTIHKLAVYLQRRGLDLNIIIISSLQTETALVLNEDPTKIIAII